MQTVTKYRCEVCGKVHDSQSAALSCEQNHKIPIGVTGPEYQKFGSNSSFPTSVMVEFGNESRMRYYRTPGKR